MVVCVPNTDGLEEKVVVAWPSTRKCLQAAAMQAEESKLAKEGGGGGGGLADEMMVVVVEVVNVG